LTMGGGGMLPSVRNTGRELDCAAGVKLVKQSESPHRERAEIVRSCLVVMFSPFMKWNPWNRGIRWGKLRASMTGVPRARGLAWYCKQMKKRA